MSKIEDGGPAFPGGAVRKTRPAHDPGADFRVTDITEPKQSGMTLRDYFAAKAMQGMWASDTEDWRCSDSPDGLASRAAAAYEMADAMLAAREAA